MDFYKASVEESLSELKTSLNGLGKSEVEKRIEKFGYNEIIKKKEISKIAIFLGQFKSFLVIILIIATVISSFLGEIIDAAVILAIVVINAIFGFFQEYKAEKAIAALKKMTSPLTKVIREGLVTEISARDIVPGDIVVFDEGDRVAADCRLIESISMRADESALTGESVPVSKNTDMIKKNTNVNEMKNMIFMGTTVTYGRGKGVVVSTGMKTEIGKIAKMIDEPEEQTPLQIKLSRLGRDLGLIIIFVCAVVTIFGVMKGNPLISMFITGVALAVASIPEGLPAVVTITLALGLEKMAKKNSLVRRLPAVETLGCTTIICSDKTGTLTKNEMTVREIYCNEKIFNVTGEGYQTKGEFFYGKEKIDPKKDGHLFMLLQVATLCNNASLTDNGIIGDPTEGSLTVLAAKAGLRKNEMLKEHKFVKENPFSSERKLMSVVYKYGVETTYVKGASEIILKLCNRIYKNGKTQKLTDQERDRILKTNGMFAGKALRVLAFAYKEVDKDYEEKNLVFLGLAGMIDPPRPEVKDAIKTCEKAGIDVVMITGDHEVTAKAIAEDLGIFKPRQSVISGSMLDKMSDEDLRKQADKIRVYARVSPEHKVRIVEALRTRNHIIAMTGDGVNDAPALKKADIGVSMGLKGTDVAKEASDMILKDDNFATIVDAIKKGRTIYDNVKKFVQYLLYANIGEVCLILFAMLLGFTDPETGMMLLPLIPAQILWLNLITDGLPALALGVDPPSRDVMERKPRNPKEHIITKNTIKAIAIFGFVIGLGSLLIFSINLSEGAAKARTMAFTTIVLFELFLALGISMMGESKILNTSLIYAFLISLFLHTIVIYVPLLQVIFETVPLSLSDWVQAAAMPFVVLVTINLFGVFKKIY